MASSKRSQIVDNLAMLCAWGAAALVSGFFAWMLFDIIIYGAPQLSYAFLVDDAVNAGRSGGIGPIIVSTLLILAVCMGVSLPIGVGCAIMLSEFTSVNNLFTVWVRRSLDVLAGVPSIVLGLFGYAFFCQFLGLGFSILAGGLTLACMVLPILIRSTEEGLRSVPDEMRHAAAALALSKTGTLMHILLPAASPGLLVGLVLGIGRALAETAALVFTSGYVDRMPSSLMDSGRALSIHIYDLSMNVAGGDKNAYASALVLMIVLLIINSLASFITERFLHRRVIPV